MNIPTLQYLEFLARAAGKIIMRGYNPRPGSGSGLRVEHKGLIDLVTEYDRRSEDFILGEIRERFPNHKIVTEESGIIDGDESRLWYIDPVDGTVNYAHGLPYFSVSIAYTQDGALYLGAVYDPTRDEMFSAEAGVGAWLNGEPVQPASARHLDHALLSSGFPYDIRTNQHNNLDHFARFALRSQGVRRLASAALDLCYVASGRLDGYWELHLKPWDVAAGGLIARQAGALVTQVNGDPDFLTPPFTIFAANPMLHARMLEILSGKD